MQALEEKLQYHFKNPALLEEALRHSSYANEHRGANFFSNERLEFLGDSVLGFVTAEYLFAKHPTAHLRPESVTASKKAWSRWECEQSTSSASTCSAG